MYSRRQSGIVIRPSNEEMVRTLVIVQRCSLNPAVGWSETPVGVEPTRSCFAGSRRAVWLQRRQSCSPRIGERASIYPSLNSTWSRLDPIKSSRSPGNSV